MTRKKSVMLLPINEINENFSNPDRDRICEEEEKYDGELNKRTVTVLLTGQQESGKHLLFSRLISHFHSIPFSTISKEGIFEEGKDKTREDLSDILISVLKGLVDNASGSVQDTPDTPLPYIVYENQEIRF